MRRVVALALLAGFGAVLAIGTLWPQHDIHAVDLLHRHAAPSVTHWLGTDHLGRDLFARLARGGWNALLATAIAACTALIGGVVLGLAAAFGTGGVRFACLRLADLTLILPQFVIAVLVIAVAGFSAWSVGLALGIGGIGTYAIMTQGLADGVLRERFILAAEAAGGSRLHVIRQHIFPALLPQLRTYVAAEAGHGIVHYAALAFLGLGADTGRPDWGSMLFEYRLYLFDNPGLLLWPGIAICVLVSAIHFAFEPRPTSTMQVGLFQGRWKPMGSARKALMR
jgi:peptide/nickel transport system permease protein